MRPDMGTRSSSSASMSDMTEEKAIPAAANTIVLAGRVIGIIRPTQGQMESLIRIGRSLRRGTDDDTMEFWQTQIDRIGTLLDSLIAEGDRETVDTLYLTGKIDHTTLLTAILGKVRSEAEESEEKAIVKAKANVARVKRQ